MTPTRTETLSLTDGRTLRLTVAEPENVVRGGLVVLHEARGVTDTVRGLVSGLAAEGWLAVAPHLYHGAEDEPEDAAERVSELSGESVLADTDVAFVWLGQRGVSADRLGVMGFDLGGSVAMVVAGSRSIGAAVTVGGGGILEPLSDGLPSLVEVAEELACPWLGLYGDDDEKIPFSDVEKLRDAAADAPVATDVVRFEHTSHRFDTRPEASAEAWQRALNWFDSHLR
ncbi:carboxymethylenebutenolidase [Saccharothrix tamanrassetensis]|uniref:Carboxymethylenebutenolidase n=1 Tax=Saccharothrix tamanrassetensis TaxID=1051531 RepID=A0A841CNK6_9PSEU|nr:dienelactone hydrolase family protein [Saccharothrix tamanrassetensis]MBB5958889.1 carboxymethylenebutenolidase [Saccharothrix tamanrassetensis]